MYYLNIDVVISIREFLVYIEYLVAHRNIITYLDINNSLTSFIFHLITLLAIENCFQLHLHFLDVWWHFRLVLVTWVIAKRPSKWVTLEPPLSIPGTPLALWQRANSPSSIEWQIQPNWREIIWYHNSKICIFAFNYRWLFP